MPGIVANERTDRFLIEGEWVELPVAGIFEVRDGLIHAWRDYFDMGHCGPMLAALDKWSKKKGRGP